MAAEVGGRGSGGGGAGGAIGAAIRRAYHKLAPYPGAFVGLADLRDKLGEKYNRHEVDAALKAMLRDPAVRIIPIANAKSLTQRDRDAALYIGGEANYALNIGKNGKPSAG